MSMGYAGGSADVVKTEAIVKFCPKEFEAFMDSMGGKNLTLDELARGLVYDELTDKYVEEALDILLKAFKKKTGLEIELGFHDIDNGDSYDEINGAYFGCVGGMYELTKAGKKMQKHVEHKNFVMFG